MFSNHIAVTIGNQPGFRESQKNRSQRIAWIRPRQTDLRTDMSMCIHSIFEKDSEVAEKSKKDEAQAQLAKLQRANDAKTAAAEYEAVAAATRAKTERLRALRLARDAAAPPPAAPKRKAKTKDKSVGLSDWLDDQAKEGRRR
jgi:hypothetical protein